MGVSCVSGEVDGRLIAEIPALPGVIAYGSTPAEARTKAAALALDVIADRLDREEITPAVAVGLIARIMAAQLDGEERANTDTFASRGAMSSRWRGHR
jgi:predicted RNase H-like HicB family nuclease